MALITVMIVEDERLTLDDLRTIVDWEALGYKIVATAYNGKQGLKKYRECQPQLILTDIRMPFMDGIEMISEIRKTDHRVSIVLLTAYEDFGYAKAAIRLGITEYIMKSEISPETMTTLLTRLSASIQQQNRDTIIVTDRMLEQFFLSDQMEANADFEQYLKKMFYIILAEQDLPLEINGESFRQEIAVPKVKIVNLLSHMQYVGWHLEAITSLSGGQIVLAMEKQGTAMNEKSAPLFSCAEQIQRELTRQTLCSFTMYVFSSRTNLYELKQYCDANKSIFSKKYFAGSGQVYSLMYPMMTEKLSHRSEGIDSDAEEAFALRDKEELRRHFAGKFRRLVQNENVDQLAAWSRDYYYALQNKYRQLTGRTSCESLCWEQNWREWLDAGRLSEWFTERFYEIHEEGAMGDGRYSRPIMAAITYIYHNYPDPDLSLNDVAEHVHLSVGYLSGAFKREVGDTLKNYITEVRIEAAKKLIEKGNYKIYEIGQEVGYRSSQYFSQVFYRKTGMFPTEYKKKE